MECRSFDDEYFVLDTETNQAHELTGDVALVWRAVEDRTWPDLSDERVDEVVAELIERGLLVSGGISRRTMLVAGGVTVAGLSTLALPTVAMAASEGEAVVYSATAARTNLNSDKASTAGITASNTFSIAPGATSTVALVGGGGAGGEQTGQDGQPGDVWCGTIVNGTGSYQALGFSLGGGGQRSTPYYGAGGAGVGNGGVNSQTVTEGGGGASSILLGSTVLAVANGGEAWNNYGSTTTGASGGTGTANPNGGPAGLTVTTTSTNVWPATATNTGGTGQTIQGTQPGYSGAPSNFVKPTFGGSTPGSGGGPGYGGYQGGLYVTTS